jgi:DNA-binding NarL/FixJ family response regulator
MTEPGSTIRVLIADDNRSVRKGLRLQLEHAPGVRVIGEVATGTDAVITARNEHADVVLMDVQMPGMSGIEATRALTARGGPPAVVVMTSYAVDAYVIEALDAGAVGYLLKSHDSAQIVDAVRAAARGEALVSPPLTGFVLGEFKRRGAPAGPPEEAALLSPAERRIVATLSSGVTSNEAIAEALHVSVHTVRSQLQSALKKLSLDDRTQLALWGVRHDIDGARVSSD